MYTKTNITFRFGYRILFLTIQTLHTLKSFLHSPTKLSGYYEYICHMLSHIRLSISTTQRAYVFRKILTVNSECFPKQH
jgi:hypothetical protein